MIQNAKVLLRKPEKPIPAFLYKFCVTVIAEPADLYERFREQCIDSQVYIFMEGTFAKLSAWWAEWEALDHTRSSFATPCCLVALDRLRAYSPFKDFKVAKLAHFKDCRGVTSRRLQVAVRPSNLWVFQQRTNVEWKWMNFVSSTGKGRTAPPPAEISTEFNVGNWEILLSLPSVFSATGWSSRRLLPKELFRLFELPQFLDEDLKIEFVEDRDEVSKRFQSVVFAPPTSLIFTLMSSLSSFPFFFHRTSCL